MSRIASSLTLIGIALASCGHDDEARTAKARAASAAVRPAYEKRMATIRSVTADARTWKGRSGVPALVLGSRPTPQFTVDAITSRPLAGTNGRILELDDAGSFEASAKKLHYGDTRWLSDINESMRDGGGHGASTAGSIERTFEGFDAVRYLCLLVADVFEMPKVRSGSAVVFSLTFDPGVWKGKLLLYDLTTGDLVGGTELSATNAAKVNFNVKGGQSVAEDEKTAQFAFEGDLRRNLMAAVDRALGAPASPSGPSPASSTKSHDVWLVSMGARKLEVIKAVRALTGLGLKETKDLVEAAPKLVRAGLARADAEAAQKSLESAGATAEIR